MDKDLRDAFKALSLVRADLVATRQAKHDSDAQWRALVAQQQAQLTALRETLAMRDEDVPTGIKTKGERETSPEAEPEREDHQMDSTDAVDHGVSLEDVAKDHMTLLASVYALKTQVQQQSEQLLAQEAQFVQERSEWTLRTEATTRQLADLQETKRDLVRDKKFMDEKFEFLGAEVDVVKSERDALKRELEQAAPTSERTESETMGDAWADEKQQLAAQHAEREQALSQTNASLQQTIDQHAVEMERLQQQLEAATSAAAADAARREEETDELKRQYDDAQHKQATAWREEQQVLIDAKQEALDTAAERADQVDELQRALECLRVELTAKQTEIDGLVTDRTELIQQLQQIRDHSTEQLHVHAKEEEERMKTQQTEQEKLQQELTTLLTSFEAATSENAVKMSSLQCSNEALQRALTEKAREAEDAEYRGNRAQDELQSLALVVDLYRHATREHQTELQEHRRLVVDQQEQMKQHIQQVQSALLARYNEELDKERKIGTEKIADMEQQLAASEIERRRVEDELQHAQDAARTLREELDAAEQEREAHQLEREEATQHLQAALEERGHEVATLNELMHNEKERLRCAHDEQLAEIRAVHDKALQTARVEQEGLAREVSELNLALHRLESDLSHARAAAEQAEVSLRQRHDMSQGQSTERERRLQALEQQLMATEDTIESSNACASWSALPSQIRQLDDFLPQLQLFAGRLHTSLQLCAENASAMHVLSASPSASPSLRSDLSTLLRLAEQWKQLFDTRALAVHVRLVRRSVLATLSQWYEEGDEPSGSGSSPPPPPPFEIDSQEVTIVLQNWTSDEAKRERVAHWLKQIATHSRSSNSDDDQATLELKDMTREVKDAFCMLIVPLLQQNRAVSVRVFTRRVCDVKSSYSPDETCWEMRIHVLFTPRQTATPPHGGLRRISSTSSVSSVGSTTSSIASSLSLSSISSASKLQIIQARLQQMQQQQP